MVPPIEFLLRKMDTELQYVMIMRKFWEDPVLIYV